MTATAKLAISLPRPLAERTRRAVRKGRAASVSAYVAEALEEKTKMDDLAGLLDEMLAESGGPLTRRERARAAAALGLGAAKTGGAR
jgi:Arc/MetJ-type ribon-helix-helix transcriptional regulator